MKNKLETYNKLTELVNSNLQNSNLNAIIFERYENFSNSIYKFPYTNLISIQNHEEFLYEVYYKMLDRVIDDISLRHFLHLFKHKKITKSMVIKSIFKSDERKFKKTLIDFNS